ncbi:MAG: hypothetical protein LBS77_05090, partial [Desulfovibrio sp.]|nr:hypothetical protein [Desulfovibrio sp.]
KTTELIRNRGWAHWNHLFNARQLYLLSKFVNKINNIENITLKIVGILGLNKCINWNSRLCLWNIEHENSGQTYYNQALNIMINWGTRSLIAAETSWFYDVNNFETNKNAICELNDARSITSTHSSHIWFTDQPYVDTVNYHELSEFFLVWNNRLLKEAFPEWYADSKRVLAVRGGEGFAQSMIEIYSNLIRHMRDDGIQVVMCTHTDPAVWAQLALIMWSGSQGNGGLEHRYGNGRRWPERRTTQGYGITCPAQAHRDE